jgi:molybdenum cofactor biosynthesis protein B
MMGTEEHKKQAPKTVRAGILTVSTTRALADDASGNWISGQLKQRGHNVVCHQVITDDTQIIAATVKRIIEDHRPQVILMSGGTGITARDVTIEAVAPLFTKELTAFGPLFANLSFAQIGSAAFLSRATAGVIGSSVVVCMPGSLKACQLACSELVFPELGHLVKHLLD